MTRRPNRPCSNCGRLLYCTAKSRSTPTCQPCRRTLVTPEREPALCAGGCGRTLLGNGRSLPPGKRTCRTCQKAGRGTPRFIPVPNGSPGPCDGCGTTTSNHKNGKGRLCDRCRTERQRAHTRQKNHLRRIREKGDVTAEYEQALRRKAKRCPMAGCGVRLIDTPKQPNSKELDHIVPINMGGTHTIGNVRIICRSCNLSRPHDGSDFTGQLTLWSQDPEVAQALEPSPAQTLEPSPTLELCDCGLPKMGGRCYACESRERRERGRAAAALRAQGTIWRWRIIAAELGYRNEA